MREQEGLSMANVIRLLPDSLANQIAAGEVVQRPASVVKELMENAVDAGSTEIKLIVKQAGKSLIQVIDNGKGMNEVDARMCFERHATSKLKSTEDLFKILTMGFRGEALASIAAVSQVELITCTPEEGLGTKVILEGRKVQTQEPVNAPVGTQVSVKNLFFNVPARRNFLKSNPVENKHIIDEFQRIALAYPHIGFSFFQDGIEMYQLPPTKLSHRIVHLFGRNYREQLLPCQEATELLQLEGYIGKPENAKKTRGEQFFFVNNRFIKSAYLHHAVKQAFEELLPLKSFPFYVLCLTIPPEQIDINVHPTKTEIKFEEERMVYSIVEAAVKKALAVHHVTPSIDFNENVNSNPFAFSAPVVNKEVESKADRNYAQFRSIAPASIEQPWEKAMDGLQETQAVSALESVNNTVIDHVPEVEQLIISSDAAQKKVHSNDWKVQLHGQYLLASVKSGLLVVNQKAAHERILYEKYFNAFQQNGGASQQLLFPVTLKLNLADVALVEACKEELSCLGFALELSEDGVLTVLGLPIDAADQEPEGLIEGILEQFKWNQDHLSLPKPENWARTLAKRTCLKTGKALPPAEMSALVDQLFSCETPNYTAEGEKTFVIMPLEAVHSMFSGE